MENLVLALEDIAVLSDSTSRNRLVEWIDSELRVEDPESRLNPDRASNQRADLIGIVTAVLNSPRALPILSRAICLLAPGQPATNALRDLCSQVAQREPVLLDETGRMSLLDELAGLAPSRDVAALLAEATAPAPPPITAGTLRAAVARLERRTSPVPLFRFLELTAGCATTADSAAALQHWIDGHLDLVPASRRPELAALRQRLLTGPATQDGRPSLEIRMEPVDEDRFSVLAWLSAAGPDTAANCGPENTLTRLEITQWLGQLLDCYASTVLAPERRARVDFILPASHLNEPVDGWSVTYGGETHRLGTRYRVAVRPDTRSVEGAQRLTQRWKITSRIIATEHVADDVVGWLTTTSSTDLWPRLDRDDWAWLAITCPMMGQTDAAVTAVVDTGTPVALWIRGDRAADLRQRVLTDVCRARQIDELPESVWAFRRHGWTADDDVRRDLVLMWDDPTRPPPDGPSLIAPRPQEVRRNE
ncbi:hypothetical protein AB0C22_23900 [Micromonospora sp. NPDC048894]|uniref:VMAP-C domain-containing protein n=1 Tax=Micromonospora sp. NPDC048894 TaxID=3155493 RepID=UPI0033D2C981